MEKSMNICMYLSTSYVYTYAYTYTCTYTCTSTYAYAYTYTYAYAYSYTCTYTYCIPLLIRIILFLFGLIFLLVKNLCLHSFFELIFTDAYIFLTKHTETLNPDPSFQYQV